MNPQDCVGLSSSVETMEPQAQEPLQDPRVEEVRAIIETIKRKLHYLEHCAPEKLETLLEEVNELRRMIA